MRTLGLAVVMIALAAGRADASWYFRWECFDAACAQGHLSRSGIEGPYASENECGHARARTGFELNSNGGAGNTGDCYDTDAPGGAGGGGLGSVHPLQLARIYVSALYAPPWHFVYGDGTAADSGPITGGEIELDAGHERLGVLLLLGFVRAAGPPARTGRPQDVIWGMSFGLGLHSSPFALVRRGRLEIRPELGVAIADIGRLSCEACQFMIGMKEEPSDGLGVRARVGVDIYLGRRRADGVALEAMYQPLVMNPDEDPADPLSAYDTRIEAPTWWLRLSYVHRDRTFAAF